jgi:acetylornithine deacetylase/succinyl-diaminopimelate desuccinylase-like protein
LIFDRLNNSAFKRLETIYLNAKLIIMKTLISTLILIFCISITDALAQKTNLKPSKKALNGLEMIRSNQPKYNDWLIEIGGIISPSGQELERAQKVNEYMQNIGLTEVTTDEQPNTIGILPGQIDSVIVMVSTLDDLAGVAENQRAVGKPPYVDGSRVVGPGTNTSSTTVAILAAAEAMIATGVKPYYTIVFASVAQEETGLVGMKQVFEQYKNRAVLFVDVLGDGHRISYGALGIHWWKVTAMGPTGHTLRSGWPGQPHVNQAIGRAVDRILSLRQPVRYDSLNTRLNVGMIHSGNVYNHKPAEGYFTLDIRSLDNSVIEETEAAVQDVLTSVTTETEVIFKLAPFQIMDGGQIDGFLNSWKVQKSLDISRYLGYEPGTSNAGSSNMNVALSKGYPAIGLGGNRGENRGKMNEYADSDAMINSACYVFLLAQIAR